LSSFPEIKKALEYIDGHLDEPISLKAISERFHFSPYYFHRMFSAIVGKTFAVHVRDRRLQLACVQLSSTDDSIVNIGLACGYDSAQSCPRASIGTRA
jgi:AraC-like DNA-binding protein